MSVKCPRCSAAIGSGAKYCQACGRKLEQGASKACFRCNNELFPGARFCHSCGLPVAGVSGRADTGFVRAYAALERLVPEPYLKQLLAARGRATAERRVVTILFCDIEGSTALGELFDPEEVMNVVNKAFKVIVEPIFRHEGTLARFMGDAVLAFFGAPVAHEDDAVRACRAAAEIIAATRSYADELERERGVRGFNVRVGINTGLVVVGEVGTDYRVEYTAMGDAVNLAARMESSAESGTVLLTESTMKLVDQEFETADLGFIEVKGKFDPVHIYRLLKPRPISPARVDAAYQAPLVGRKAELERLNEALEGLENGTGRTIAIVGGHGLGKSRIVSEARRSCPPDAAWFTGWSAQRLQDVGYWVARQLLQGMIDAEMDGPREGVLDALSRSVSDLFGSGSEPRTSARTDGATREDVLFCLARILDIPDEALVTEKRRVPVLEVLRQRTRSAFCEFVTRFSANRPVVLVWEDLSWVDPSSLELLEALIPLTGSNRIVLILVFRDEEGTIRQFHERMKKVHGDVYETLEIRPLADVESARLVSSLFEGREIPESTRRLILDRAEGNAFFLEQVSRSLIEAAEGGGSRSPYGLGSHLETLDVPTTVHSVVMSRMDRLPPDAKQALQIASVVGRVFQHAVLDRVVDPELRGERLERSLEELRDRGFLRSDVRKRDPVPPGARTHDEEPVHWIRPLRLEPKDLDGASTLRSEYAITHAMTAEVAYSSLLKSQRRELHRRTGELIESLTREISDEMVPLLAHHFEHAGIPGKAYSYAARAGDRAARLYANQEAVAHYSKALYIAGELEGSGTSDTALDPAPAVVHEALADVYFATGAYAAAIDHFNRALAASGGSPSVVTLHRKKGQIYEKWGKYDDARLEFESALGRMQSLDSTEAAHIYSGLGMVSYHQGNLDEAQEIGTIALEIMATLEDERGTAQAYNNLGMVHCRKGNFTEAQSLCERSVSLWENLADVFGLAIAYNNLGLVALRQKDPGAALTYFEKARALFEKLGNKHGLARCYDNLSQAFLDRGQQEKAFDYMKQAVSMLAGTSADPSEIAPEMWQSGEW
jgi:class 3 adenylate cyclase/tetratricopeptide (TPR) repeat protein